METQTSATTAQVASTSTTGAMESTLPHAATSSTTYDLARLAPIVAYLEALPSVSSTVPVPASPTTTAHSKGQGHGSEPRPVRVNGMLCSRGCIKASLPCVLPAYICQRESKMFVDVWNPTENASGKYQFIRSTWNNYGGYRNAGNAPEAVQDAKAREMWAGGRGCSHWSAC